MRREQLWYRRSETGARMAIYYAAGQYHQSSKNRLFIFLRTQKPLSPVSFKHIANFRLVRLTTITGAFGGLLARGITEMRGVGGLKGWSWIFILEGLVTIVFGTCMRCAVNTDTDPPVSAIIAYFYIPDQPSTAKFLTSDERTEVVRRLAEDNNGLSHEPDMAFFWDAVKDWKTYAYSTLVSLQRNKRADSELGVKC